MELLEAHEDLSFTKDELFDHFADENTKNFSKLVGELSKFILTQGEIRRLNLSKDIDGYQIELNILGKKTNIEISNQIRGWINSIEKWDKMEKGTFFEHFCAHFLNDIGLEAEVTKASGDKGIDICAKYKSTFDKDVGSLVFNDYVYLLAQAKFYKSKIDTPVIRKLLGDSLLLRFDRIDYLQIAHNAFHLLVFGHNGFTVDALEFSQENKIMTIDTEQMIIVRGKIRTIN